MFLDTDFIMNRVPFFISFVLFDVLHGSTVVSLSPGEWFVMVGRLVAGADRNLPYNLIPVLRSWRTSCLAVCGALSYLE